MQEETILLNSSLSLSRARNGEVIYGLYSVDVNITTNLMGLFHIDHRCDPEKVEPRQIVQTHVQFLRVTQTSSECTDFWIPDTAEVPISMFRPFFSFFHSCHDSSLSRCVGGLRSVDDKLLVFVTIGTFASTKQNKTVVIKSFL